MDYYVSNGIYEYLIECDARGDFFWTSGNLWLLVYGDENYNPKVLTVASGTRLDMTATAEERNAVHFAQRITSETDIPVNFVRFDPDRTFETVQYWEPKMEMIPVISAEELKYRFKQYGLRMNEATAHKSINDKSSSPYHDWQRENMGDSVVVSDIDLLRCEGGKPTEIIELKRSYIDLDKWEPYRKDYRNFILISKLARKCDLNFYIVYNRRTKVPFLDDVSQLKIFEFDHRMRTYCRLLGYKTIQQFARNRTS